MGFNSGAIAGMLICLPPILAISILAIFEYCLGYIRHINSTYKTCRIYTVHFFELLVYQNTSLIAYSNHKVGNVPATTKLQI